MNPRRLVRIACYLTAAAATLIVWLTVPIEGRPWIAVLWFTLFAALAELLALSLGDETNVGFTPTAPVYWAAIAVVGPFPSLIVFACSAAIADTVACLSYHKAEALAQEPEDTRNPARDTTRLLLLRAMSKAGSIWEMRAGENFASALRTSSQYISSLIIAAAPAGMAYHFLGGHALVGAGPELHPLRNFVGPFIALAVAFIAAEHLLHVIVMSVLDPIPGSRGVYGIVLKIKLVLIENTLPIVRAEFALVVVALLLAYLYGQIGPWGFLVAATPVIALRDFLYQWVEKKNAYLKTITTLATYMQLYHPYTRGHLKRVADVSERLAQELRLPADSIRHMRPAAMMHDIGKIAVSEEILDKVGKLDEDEWNQIREHPTKGAEIISHIEFLENIVEWIKYHHKWYDGSGYPATNGNGASVPIEASIIAVADSFDAMTDDRELTVDWLCDSCGYRPDDGQRPDECPKCGAAKRRHYRTPKTLDQAIDELRRGAGTQFHPRVVKAFLTMVERDGLHLNV